MDLLQSKIVSIVILGVSSTIVGLLPRWLGSNRRQWPMFLSTLFCFGGGVLISVSLVHILPEARNDTVKYLQEYIEIIFCLGFFLLYFTEEIAHFCYGNSHEINDSHFHKCTTIPTSSLCSTGSYGTMEKAPLLQEKKHRCSISASSSQDCIEAVVCHDLSYKLCHINHQQPCNVLQTANIGLFTALSLHSIIEGFVVGLEQQSNKVLLLLGAILSHKLVVGFCLGLELTSNELISFCKHCLFISMFAFCSVAGIGIGMLITNIPPQIQEVLLPILQGLAGGTLLYVALSEILPRERAKWHKKSGKKVAGILQFFSVAIGFTVMTILSKCLTD